jgi:hypothetical protein
MTHTLCLLCGNRRVETVCGDQSCPCTGGPGFVWTTPVVIAGMEYDTPAGPRVMARCGRLVPADRAGAETDWIDPARDSRAPVA